MLVFEKWLGNFEKKLVLHKRKFWLEKSIFGEKSTAGKMAFQSNFKL